MNDENNEYFYLQHLKEQEELEKELTKAFDDPDFKGLFKVIMLEPILSPLIDDWFEDL